MSRMTECQEPGPTTPWRLRLTINGSWSAVTRLRQSLKGERLHVHNPLCLSTPGRRVWGDWSPTVKWMLLRLSGERSKTPKRNPAARVATTGVCRDPTVPEPRGPSNASIGCAPIWSAHPRSGERTSLVEWPSRRSDAHGVWHFASLDNPHRSNRARRRTREPRTSRRASTQQFAGSCSRLPSAAQARRRRASASNGPGARRAFRRSQARHGAFLAVPIFGYVRLGSSSRSQRQPGC
jgi:hypothetical protein